MNLKFRLGLLAGLLMGSNLALADGKVYWSVGGGTFDNNRTNLVVRPAGVAAPTRLSSPSEEGDLISVSVGVADVSARALIEYYHQSGDIPGARTEYTKHALFYSGYWTPNLFVPKLHGILGAGIGAAELTMESGDPLIGGDFKDREAQFKATIGIEYRFIDLVTIYGTYEKHFTPTYSHWSAERQIDVRDGDQTVMQVGIAARF